MKIDFTVSKKIDFPTLCIILKEIIPYCISIKGYFQTPISVIFVKMEEEQIITEHISESVPQNDINLFTAVGDNKHALIAILTDVKQRYKIIDFEY